MPGSSTGNYKYSGQSSGGYGDFNQDNLDAAKNSLQLLKAKQQAKRAEDMLNSDVDLFLLRPETSISLTLTARRIHTRTSREAIGEVHIL